MSDRTTPPAERLLIVGTGGLGRETLWVAREAGVREIGFLDDGFTGEARSVDGAQVVGRIADWAEHDAEIVVAIGSPRVRRDVVGRIEAAGSPRFATLVHPSVRIGQNVTIGPGAIIAAQTVLSCDVVIGAHAVIGINVLVSHDCRFGDFVTIAPGVTVPGTVTGGAGCEVALNATMRQGTSLGIGSMVGMGAVVTRDVPDNILCYGAPAREIRPLPPFESRA